MVRLTAALATLPRRNSTHHDRDLEAFLDAQDMQRPLAGFESTCEVCDDAAVSCGLCERHARFAEVAPPEAPAAERLAIARRALAHAEARVDVKPHGQVARNTASIKPIVRDGLVMGYVAKLDATGTTHTGPRYALANEFLEQRGFHRVSGKAARGEDESWEQVNPHFGIDCVGPALAGVELQQVTAEVAHV